MSFSTDLGMGAAGQSSSGSQRYGTSFARDMLEQRQNAQLPPFGDGRSMPRKPTPSPLQTSDISGMGLDGTSMKSPMSPTFRSASDSQYSPRSPRSSLITNTDQPKSPQERLNDFFASEATTTNGDTDNMGHRAIRNTMASPSKAQSYSQLRNSSSPLPQSRPLGNSSPPSPRSTASPVPTGTAVRLETRPMPRTSSIDSAISTISVGTSHSYKSSQDICNSGAQDIINLINIAGSAEALIQHLLKKEQHSAAQTAQLWKVVEKQRALVHGLNQDLDRAVKDKERYRRRLREHLDTVPPIPSTGPKASTSEPRATSRSPAASEASADLPIQRQDLEYAYPNVVSTLVGDHSNGDAETSFAATQAGLGEADNWVRNKARSVGTNHSHKATSSSDVGIFGPSKTVRSITPIQTSGLDTSSQKGLLEGPSQVSQIAGPVVSPNSSFTAKRSQPFSAKPFHGPILALTESSPPANDLERMTPPRKPPPAPLDLGQPKREDANPQHFGPEDHSGSEYDDNMEVDELPALRRGRKKTREDDDKERAAEMLKEKQDRSRSKKEKGSKPPSGTVKLRSKGSDNAIEPHNIPIPSSIKALSPEPAPAGVSAFLLPPTSLASVLSPSDSRNEAGTTERIVSTKPMSPGLPLSPRPSDRPMNPPTPRMPRDGGVASVTSPPLSPRNGFVGLPLSPRAPRQPIPLPHTPMSVVSPMLSNIEPRNNPSEPVREPTSPISPVKNLMTPYPNQSGSESGFMTGQAAEVPKASGVFKGFVSEAYPDFLIPPNALPSIIVKVVSSRLKPSRHSLVLKGADDEPVFTLGVSARSYRQELWQVEKPISSLQQLDHQLRQSPAFNIKLPDRSLFSGHAPAKIDARRVALEKYFETILDTLLDEKAALVLCRYLSTQVSEPSSDEANGTISTSHSGSPVMQGSDGRLVKEGYLTKRGKNFGGWKARFFVLDGPVLRYYETPGGSLLGTIKLHNAQIGKQAQNKTSHSPSRGAEDSDGQYRHAFLIREPKRKDSNSFMDHVLCAESDVERDAWVAALLCYVEGTGNNGRSRPPLSDNDPGSTRTLAVPSKKDSLKSESVISDSPDSESFDSLQAVSYEDTKPAQAPHVIITPDPRPTDSPSPTTSGSQPSIKNQSSQSKAISAPSNGAKISDVGAWGNKPMTTPIAANQKEHKKRSIWGFRDKNASDIGVTHPNESNLSLTQQQYQEQITNVKAAFGAPLAEAVEYCAPRGMDICLPAVVYRCLAYLEAKNAANEEGIFRMSGSNTVIKKLRSRFNAEGDFDFLADEHYYDVHAVASLLKLYLRELPTNILTRELHLDFISVLGK